MISLGYGALLAALGGHTLLDPAIYVSALIGGELIDFIDHPLYQLVFARNDYVVKEARIKLKREGFRSWVNYLIKKEDERKFNRLRLHNVFSLTLIAFVSIFTSLYMPGTVYSFIMLGSFLLHMLTDIYGDFKLLGHYDNWLWVLPQSVLDWFGKLGGLVVWIVLLWWVDILFGFFVVSLRAAWQFYRPSTYWGLIAEAANQDTIPLRTDPVTGMISSATSGELWLAYGPLLLLMIYFILIFLFVIAGAHKIHLETPLNLRGHRSRFSTGSIKIIWKALRGKLPKGQRKLEKMLLAMQSDQAVWILVVTVLIALLLLIENRLNFSLPIILYTPVVCALVFGTLVHSTIGEYAGVQGVLLATFLNLIFTEPSSIFRWPYYYGYYLFLAACGAWILGLLGGIILRDNKRLSLITFIIQVRQRESRNVQKGSGDDVSWHYNVMSIAQHGLEEGYKRAHKELFGETKKPFLAIGAQSDYLISPQTGNPVFSGEYYHLKIIDSVIPMFQDIAYVLCDNRITHCNHTKFDGGDLLPTLPRTRVILNDPKNSDILWKQGKYYWEHSTHTVCLPSCENAQAWLKPNTYLGLVKTWGELFDNLVTRKSNFRTDLYLFASPNNACTMTFCGLSRTATSTKEYATLESECYANEVINAILESAAQKPGIEIVETQSARIIYPGFAFDDQKTVDEIARSAVFPAHVRSCYSEESASLLTKALNQIPGTKRNLNMITDLNRRLILLAGQLGLSFPSTFSFISEKFSVPQFIQDIINYLRGI